MAIEPIKEQVKLDATVGTAPFETAFDNAAMTPTMLGQAGSIAAQGAANLVSQRLGYDAGLTPHGDILPPLTKADEAYQKAYIAQSSNVLSLQMNEMLLKANEEIQSAYQLTPDMIMQYQSQMMQGAQEILSNAPTAVRSSLEMHYASQIQNSSHKLTLRLANQNKQRAQDHMKVVDKQIDVEIINKAMAGDMEGARALYESKLENNQRQLESGMMSESQAYTSNESAKLSLYTAQSNALALAARRQGGDALDKYLSSLANFDNKPDELSYDQYNTMGNNTLRFMSHLDQLEQNQRNDIISELDAKLFSGTLTDQDIEQARKEGVLKQSDINTLTAKWNRWQATHANAQNSLLSVSNGFSDTTVYSQASAKKQNESYAAVVASSRQKKPDAEPGTIEAEVAAVAGGPNGAFFNQLTALSRSAIPAEMEQASRMYHIVNNRSPENLAGIPQSTLDNIRAFDAFRELYPNDVAQAAAMARNVMLPKNKDQKEANNAIWADYRRQYLSTAQDRLTYAKNVLSANGFFFKPNVLSATETSQHITNIFERYLKLFNGDIDATKAATQSAVATIYGETKLNGENEVAKYPIEKYSGFDNKATFFAQVDVINSLQSQFGAYRKAFDKGRSQFFYRVKDADTWSLSGLQGTINQSKRLKESLDNVNQEIDDVTTKMDKAGYYQGIKYDKSLELLRAERSRLLSELKPLQTKIADINTWSKPIEIEQVWRGADNQEGRVETFKLSLSAGENTSFSYDASQPILGDYDVFLVSPTGARFSIQALGGHSMLPVVYTPNFKAIRTNTSGFINASGGQSSYEEAMKAYKAAIAQRNAKPKPLSPDILSSRGLVGQLAQQQFGAE